MKYSAGVAGVDGLLDIKPPVGIFERPSFAPPAVVPVAPLVVVKDALTHRSVSEYLVCLAAAGLILYYAPGKWKLTALAPGWWGLAGFGLAPTLDSFKTLLPETLLGVAL